MIDVSGYKILEENRSTLKKLSWDNSNNSFMTDSTHEAVDFDKVKTKYTNNLDLSEENAKSVDALTVIANEDVFIEFKNGNMKNEKKSVESKIRDSLLILGDIVGCNISQTRETMNFILVYNKEKNPDREQRNSRNLISEHIMGKADMEKIRFGLEKFQSLYFKEVHTYDEMQFKKYLEDNNIAVNCTVDVSN